MNPLQGATGGAPGLNSPSEFNGVKIQLRKEVSDLRFRYTRDIIDAAERGLLPDKIMITVHLQRWTDRPLPWVRELVGQNVKNIIKSYFYV